MPADDKLDILRDMLLLIGEAVLPPEKLAQLSEMSARYEQLKATSGRRSRAASPKPAVPIPDVYAEYRQLAPEEFTRWASGLEIAVLKQIVKAHQFDPAGLSARWRKSEKFAELIHEQLVARSTRGEGFARVIGSSSS